MINHVSEEISSESSIVAAFDKVIVFPPSMEQSICSFTVIGSWRSAIYVSNNISAD